MARFQDGLLASTRSGDLRWAVLLCLSLGSLGLVRCDGFKSSNKHITAAVVTITYKDPVTGEKITEKEETGRYATTNVPQNQMEKGLVVHVRSADKSNDGCEPIVNAPESGEKWVALIKRGRCRFHDKIINAIAKNASAVMIYNHEDDDYLLTMEHQVGDHVAAIFISLRDGERIASLVDNGTRVHMLVTVGQHLAESGGHVNKTSSLLFTAFIVLMISFLA